MRFTFRKHEKLKSRKLIGKLFEEGKSVKKFPLRLVYLQTEHTSDSKIQAGFSVPKRNFKRAVDRNRIKRLMREAYRLNQSLTDSLAHTPVLVHAAFVAKSTEANFETLQKDIITLLNKLRTHAAEHSLLNT